MKHFPTALILATALTALTIPLGKAAPVTTDATAQIRYNEPTRPLPCGTRPLDINPPTFRWAGDWKKPYELQIKPAGADWANAETASGVENTFYRPQEPLKAGAYEWRVRQKGGEWLETTAFQVTGNETRWPIEPWDKVFARFEKRHPRILVTPDTLPAVRAKAQGPMKAFMEEWVAQFSDRIGAELPSFEFKMDKKAGTNEKRRKKLKMWASQKAAKELMDGVGEMAFLAMVLERDDLANEAIRRTMEATKLDPKGFTNAGVSDFANGMIVRGAARTYDYLYDRLSGEQRKAIREMLLARALQYRHRIEQKAFQPHGWQHVIYDCMMGNMAIWDESPRAKEWLQWMAKMSVAMFPWYGGADGGSVEGGSYYGNANLPSALALATLWKQFAGLEVDHNPWFHNTVYFLMYGHQPGAGVSRLGDHGPAYPVPHPGKAIAAIIAGARYDAPLAVAYGRRVLADDGEGPVFRGIAWKRYLCPELWLLEGPFDDAPSEPLDQMPPARAFRDVGIAFMHSDYADPARNVRLEFRSSPFGSYGHSHMDQNTFNIMAAGEEIVLDSGHYIAYRDKHHAGWTQQTKAHNAILIDGKGQGPRGIESYGRIVGFASGKDWAWVAGDASHAYSDVQLDACTRHIVWLGDGAMQTYLVCDFVRVAGGGKHDYSWLLHFPVEPQFAAEGQDVSVRGEKSQAVIRFLGDPKWELSKTHEFDPPAENWRPDKKGRTYPKQWHLTAHTSGAPADTVFRTVVCAQPDTKTPLEMPKVKWQGNTARVGDYEIVFEEETISLSKSGRNLIQSAGDR